MELNIAGGVPLKTFTRSINALIKLSSSGSAADIDFTATSDRLSLSVVNASRTAFAVAHFNQRFFAHYDLQPTHGGKAFKFAVTGKALLSALRPRSASTVGSISISVGPDDPNAPLVAPSDDDRSSRSGDNSEGGGVFLGIECRVVIKLFCQHGVIKTHRLTYSNPNVNNWAKFDKSACSSSWKASGRVLKDWLDHFHLRSGGGGKGADSGSTDEITFYCSPFECRLKSFNEAAVGGIDASDPFHNRALSTELIVDVEDFDLWDVHPQNTNAQLGLTPSGGSSAGGEVVTFGLKEFKAIISLCDTSSGPSHSHHSESSSLPLSAHFTSGGRPLLLSLSPSSDEWEARFVLATTDYDSGGGGGGSSRSTSAAARSREGSAASVKREMGGRDGSVASARATPALQAQAGPGPATTAARAAAAGAAPSTSSSSNTHNRRPLFNAPTPAPGAENDDDDEDEYGGGFDDDGGGMFDDMEGAFAEIDRLTQVAAASQAGGASQAAGRGGGGGGAKELVRDTSEAGPSAGGRGDEDEGEPDTEDEDDAGVAIGSTPAPVATDGGTGMTQLGPTQAYGDENDARAVKRPRWNLLGDD
ncbi:hypothetical protein JCM8097_002065 [Rhodosporidiobolus ruineniae]